MTSYADAAPRFARWLRKYQSDRKAHAQARRAHPDPAVLDAEFAHVIHDMRILGLRTKPLKLRKATKLLLKGARAHLLHFPDFELSVNNFGDIVDVLDGQHGKEFGKELKAFLEALTTSGSAVVLSNRRYVGNGGMELPYFVLDSVVIGQPWRYNYDPQQLRLGSPGDLAFRRTCLRLLARMSFLSAEQALSNGETHPFMVLLRTKREDFLPLLEVNPRFLTQQHPTNQGAFLQVLYLMIFVYEDFPWPRRQHLADVEHAQTLILEPHWPYATKRTSIANCAAYIAGILPGFLQALLVDRNLWHVLATYVFDGPAAGIYSRKGEFLLNRLYCGRREEDGLVALLRGSRLISKWLCSEAGRWILLQTCRQRRRRVLQAVATGAPAEFAVAAPGLLAFSRGPGVSGNKERLMEWLASTIQGSKP